MAKQNTNWQSCYPTFGPGFGWGRGFGRGLGRGSGYGRGRCFRFPWLPHWWWAYPGYQDKLEISQPTKAEEKELLQEELEILQDEMKVIKERLSELKGRKGK